jgi:hypothetical protein
MQLGHCTLPFLVLTPAGVCLFGLIDLTLIRTGPRVLLVPRAEKGPVRSPPLMRRGVGRSLWWPVLALPERFREQEPGLLRNTYRDDLRKLCVI